jgi:uncharacterized membrane protein YraQ (UPF0718 family)
MLVPTIVMAVLAAVLLAIAHARGRGEDIKGLVMGARMTAQVLPLLVFAFVVAGLVQTLVPHEVVSRWVGAESGLYGIFIGTVAGGFAPGGPYVSLPIAAALLKSGASIGTLVAFLTGWSLWAISRLPMEVGLLGWQVAAVRFLCTFFFPPIAGLLAQTLFPTVR